MDEVDFMTQVIDIPVKTSRQNLYGLVYCPFNRYLNEDHAVSFTASMRRSVEKKTVYFDTREVLQREERFEIDKALEVPPSTQLFLLLDSFSEITTIDIRSPAFNSLVVYFNYEDSHNQVFQGALRRVQETAARLTSRYPPPQCDHLQLWTEYD